MKTLLFGLTLIALVGCGAKDPAPTETSTGTTPATTAAAEPAAFTNAEGNIVCPVMNKTTTKEEAVSYQDYEGKRYYFCCGGCPEKFKAEPAKYAAK
jgi:YHS domain-containing protein